jgi:lipid-A-disaccharide synthase-like uncharacterized protein
VFVGEGDDHLALMLQYPKERIEVKNYLQSIAKIGIWNLVGFNGRLSFGSVGFCQIYLRRAEQSTRRVLPCARVCVCVCLCVYN